MTRPHPDPTLDARGAQLIVRANDARGGFVCMQSEGLRYFDTSGKLTNSEIFVIYNVTICA
jgi:hypothetical protein